jgi:hypothetical protein
LWRSNHNHLRYSTDADQYNTGAVSQYGRGAKNYARATIAAARWVVDSYRQCHLPTQHELRGDLQIIPLHA